MTMWDQQSIESTCDCQQTKLLQSEQANMSQKPEQKNIDLSQLNSIVTGLAKSVSELAEQQKTLIQTISLYVEEERKQGKALRQSIDNLIRSINTNIEEGKQQRQESRVFYQTFKPPHPLVSISYISQGYDLQIQTNMVKAIKFSNDGSYFAVRYVHKIAIFESFNFFDPSKKSQKVKPYYEDELDKPVPTNAPTFIDWNKSNDVILSYCNSTFSLTRIKEKKQQDPFTFDKSFIQFSKICFLSQQLVILCTMNGQLMVWKISRTNKTLTSLQNHKQKVNSFSIRNQNEIYSVGEHYIYHYSFKKKAVIASKMLQSYITSIVVNQKEGIILSCENGSVAFLNFNLTIKKSLILYQTNILYIKNSQFDSTLLALDNKGKIALFQEATIDNPIYAEHSLDDTEYYKEKFISGQFTTWKEVKYFVSLTNHGRCTLFEYK